MMDLFMDTVKKVVKSSDLSVEEKVIICSTLTTKKRAYPWTVKRKSEAIASMELGKPYRCKDIYNSPQAISPTLNRLVKCGMVTKEVITTGNIIVILNPRVEKLQNDIDWYERYLANREATKYLGGYGYGQAKDTLRHLHAELEMTKKTFEVEEKITYFTRIV